MTQPESSITLRIPVLGLRRWTDIVLALSRVVMVPSGFGLFAWHDVSLAEAATGVLRGIDDDVSIRAHIDSSILFTGAANSHPRLDQTLLRCHFSRHPQ